MPNLPIHIEMQGRKALIVGAGNVAKRKFLALLETGAEVTVVAPFISPEFESVLKNSAAELRLGLYDEQDLKNVFLVVAATDDRTVNAKIAVDAKTRGILVVVSDLPESGNCFFPAVHRSGSLEIGVSSGGRCPAFAVQVRDLLAGIINDNFEVALEHLAVEREKLLTEGKGSTYNSKIMRTLAQKMIAELTAHKELP